MNVVGSLVFDDMTLDVYSSLDVPLFKVSDVAKLIGYSSGNNWNLLELCEAHEKLQLSMVVAGQNRKVSFVTETGLYNILSQSRMDVARKWRSIILNDLVILRKEKGMDIVEQFENWDRLSDTLFIDEETGVMMRSVTVAGGDVIQIPYVEED